VSFELFRRSWSPWDNRSENPTPAPRKRAKYEATTFTSGRTALLQSTTAEGVNVPENSNSGEVAKLGYPGGEIDLEIVQATEGSDGIALDRCWPDRIHHVRWWVREHVGHQGAITYIDGLTRAFLRYRGYRSSSWRRSRPSSRFSYLLIYGELPTTDQLRRSPPHSSGTPCCTRISSALRRLRATPTRCGAVQRPSTRCRRTTRTRLDPLDKAAGRAVDDPAAGQAAHIGRLRLQESVGQPFCTRTTR